MAEFIIKVFPASEGGLMYHIYKGDEATDENEVDGGLCTSGKVADALGMAADQVRTLAGLKEHADAFVEISTRYARAI